MSPVVIVCPTPEALARRAADEFEACCTAAMQARGRYSVALAGGKTPRAMLTELRGRNIDWSTVHFFWSDERCVAPNDPSSNYKMAYDALLSHIAVPEGNLHRVHGEWPPEAAARDYAKQLEAFFGTVKTFDVIFLGLGADGHTASLFPGSPALDVSDQSCVATRAPAGTAAEWRVTLTFSGMAAARRIIMMVEGGEKADIVARVLEEDDRTRYPAREVFTADGDVYCLLDAAAAARLRKTDIRN